MMFEDEIELEIVPLEPSPVVLFTPTSPPLPGSVTVVLLLSPPDGEVELRLGYV